MQKWEILSSKIQSLKIMQGVNKIMKNFVFCLFLTASISGCATQESFEACRDRIYDYWVQKGIKDYGEAFAYTGAGYAGQKQQVLKECGSLPTVKTARGLTLRSQDCNDLYTHVYLNCINGNEGFLTTSAAEGTMMFFDERAYSKLRLEALCREAKMIDRINFGVLICGE